VIVLAFDCDGTLDFGNPAGPVKLSWLKKLDTSEGIAVVMVSPSAKGRGFVERLDGDRLANLNVVRRDWPEAVLYIYISDNNDEDLAWKADFVHVHPKNFRLPETEVAKP